MEQIGTVYGLSCACHPEAGIRYVGQTIRPPGERMKEHLKSSRLDPIYPVRHWIRKHSPENIRMAVLEEVADLALLNAAEQRWIDTLRTFTDWGQGGLNRTRGGDSITGACEEVRERIRIANSGEQSWSKLTREAVVEIRRAYRAGDFNQNELAEQYGVSLGAINDVIRNRTWADADYVDDGPRNARRRYDYETNANLKLSTTLVAEIRESAKLRTNRQIADQYGLSMSYLSDILQNKKWTDSDFRPLSQSERALARGGAKKTKAKLTQEQADEIRVLYASGAHSYSALGTMFGVRLETIGYIVRNETWVKP